MPLLADIPCSRIRIRTTNTNTTAGRTCSSACNAEVGLPDLRVARRCNGAEGLDGDPDELIPPLCPHAA